MSVTDAAAPPRPVLGGLLPLLSLAGFLVSMDGRVIATVLPQIAGDFGVSVSLAGAIITAYMLPYGLFQLVYGPLADRIGAMRVIAGTMIGFAVSVAVCALAPDLTSLTLLRLLAGAVAAAIIGLALATIGNLTPYAGRQAAISTLMGATASGQILSAAIGGVLAEVLNWRAIFLLDGLLAALLSIPLWRRRRATPPLVLAANRHPFADHLALLRDRRAIALYLVVMIEGLLLQGGFSYLGALLRQRDGLSYLLIGLLLSLYGVGTVVTSRWLGRLSRRFGEGWLILVGCLLMGSGFLLPWLVGGWPGVLVGAPVMGIGFSLAHSTFQTRATELRPAARGTAISLFAFTLFLGSGSGTSLLGLLLDRVGYDAVLLTCGGGLIVLGLVASPLTAPSARRSG
jgi:predicted MFS family arabinose efflux permease